MFGSMVGFFEVGGSNGTASSWTKFKMAASILEILTCHISATGHPIHFVFGFRIGFSESTDRMALLPVGPNPILTASAADNETVVTRKTKTLKHFTTFLQMFCFT